MRVAERLASAGSRADEGSRGFGIWSNGRLMFRSAGRPVWELGGGWVFLRRAGRLSLDRPTSFDGFMVM